MSVSCSLTFGRVRRSVAIVGLGAVSLSSVAACGASNAATSVEPATSRVELTAGDLVASVQVPKSGKVGEFSALQYTIRNSGAEARGIAVGGCEGPIYARVESSAGLRATFRDATRTGACDDIIEVVDIPPGGEVTGASLWKAGTFERGVVAPGQAQVNLELTASVGGKPVVGSGAAEISVQ